MPADDSPSSPLHPKAGLRNELLDYVGDNSEKTHSSAHTQGLHKTAPGGERMMNRLQSSPVVEEVLVLWSFQM